MNWNGDDVAIVGGSESLSRQPFFEYHARDGWRIGLRELIDGTQSIFTDPWGDYALGVTAEKVAERYDVSREAQDAFALESQKHAALRSRPATARRRLSPSRCPGRTSRSSVTSIPGRT